MELLPGTDSVANTSLALGHRHTIGINCYTVSPMKDRIK